MTKMYILTNYQQSARILAADYAAQGHQVFQAELASDVYLSAPSFRAAPGGVWISAYGAMTLPVDLGAVDEIRCYDADQFPSTHWALNAALRATAQRILCCRNSVGLEKALQEMNLL